MWRISIRQDATQWLEIAVVHDLDSVAEWCNLLWAQKKAYQVTFEPLTKGERHVDRDMAT